MREIKFRCYQGFNSHKKGWRGLRRVERMYDWKEISFKWSLHDFIKALTENNDEDKIMMQFTGKTDNNGKEIYEGDLVHVVYPKGNEFMGKDQNYVDAVYWDDDTCGFMIKREVGADSLETGAKTIEVVGNIYETPKKTNGKS